MVQGVNVGAAEVEAMAQVGEDVAHEAGAFLLEHFHDRLEVSRKGEINLVTDVDIAAERLIVSRLQSAFPGHTVLAEELHSESDRGPITWIIDPLDGTTNYAHGYPIFSVSIGLEIQGVLEWGVVFNPNLQETFLGRRGGGACLNGVPIRVSGTDDVGSSLLATGFPYDIRTSDRNNLEEFHDFALRARGIRRGGSAAIDLCYVAAGRFDGFWELKLNPWDCSAGYLMVREAGGKVTNWHGEDGSIYDRECLATNGRIHEEMLRILTATASRKRRP